MNKIRNFIVKIYKKPFIYKIEAKNKKEAEQKVILRYTDKENGNDIHKIKVINDTNPEFYSTPLIDTQQEEKT